MRKAANKLSSHYIHANRHVQFITITCKPCRVCVESRRHTAGTVLRSNGSVREEISDASAHRTTDDRALRLWQYGRGHYVPEPAGKWGLKPSLSQANEVRNMLRERHDGCEIYLSWDTALWEGILVNVGSIEGVTSCYESMPSKTACRLPG